MGRSQRVVPDRTRLALETRDGGCRVPGCERRRWLHMHHVTHSQDGGRTDTANLVALCGPHHRAHHQGRLGISGDADEPDGLVFSDHQGRTLHPNGRPIPPGDPPAVAARKHHIPSGNQKHPSGERLQSWAVYFNPPRTPPSVPARSPNTPVAA